MTLQRVLDQDRAELQFRLDGVEMTEREGDTLLTAILAGGGGWLRPSGFGDGKSAGFCLMGACQACWGPMDGRGRRRVCGTLVAPGCRCIAREGRGGCCRPRRPARRRANGARGPDAYLDRRGAGRRRPHLPAPARRLPPGFARIVWLRGEARGGGACGAGRVEAVHGLAAGHAGVEYPAGAAPTGHAARRGQQEIGYDAVLLCTGAMDRVIPLPGWRSPGVTTLGAEQIALKAQGCAIGRRVVFLGTDPLLRLAVCQYAKAGVEVAAVFDTTRFAIKLAVLPGLRHRPAALAEGLYYTAWLWTQPIPIVESVVPLAIESGEADVVALRWRAVNGEEQRTECDAVGLSWGPKRSLPA